MVGLAALIGSSSIALACTRHVSSSTLDPLPPPPSNAVEHQPEPSEPEPRETTTEVSCTSSCPDDGPDEPVVEPSPCAPLPEDLLAVTGTIEGLRFTIPSSKGQIDPSSYERLDEIARVLARYPDVRLEVRAHEDAKTAASHQYRGVDPTRRQAHAVRQYLVRRGVAQERLQARGYGEDRPLARNDTKEGRALNRRVELVVLPNEGCATSAP